MQWPEELKHLDVYTDSLGLALSDMVIRRQARPYDAFGQTPWTQVAPPHPSVSSIVWEGSYHTLSIHPASAGCVLKHLGPQFVSSMILSRFMLCKLGLGHNECNSEQRKQQHEIVLLVIASHSSS